MSIHRRLTIQSVPLSPEQQVTLHGLVVNRAGEVLLEREAGSWRSLAVRYRDDAEAASHHRELERSLPSLGIVPMQMRLLTCLSDTGQQASFYVVFEWRPAASGETGGERRFFSLEAVPDTLSPLDRQALELLRVCWGWSTE